MSTKQGLKWEPWIAEHFQDLVDDNPLNVGYLDSIDKLDEQFGGTVTHGLARSSTSFTFESMKKMISKMPPEQLVKMDKDRDLPVHSAIQSGIRVDKKKIGLFVQGDSQQIKKILRAKNSKGKTPIELAFETQHHAAVKLLFNLCVQYNVLSNLTGINFNLRNRSNTLLHIAFRESKWSWFLDIVIDACTQFNHDIIPAIQVLDKKDYTPFHYLMNCIPDDPNELDTFRAVLDLLTQNGVDVNRIYTDSKERTMLHEAQRSNNTHAVSLLSENYSRDGSPFYSPLGSEGYQETSQQKLQKKKIFEDALRDGIVTVKITNALIQGEAGVGKTCTKRILCDQGRPSSRDSTPLADISVHVRDVTDVKVRSHNNKWKEVNDKKLQEIVGAMISGIVSEIQAKLPTETIIEDPQPVADANETSATSLPLVESFELALPVDEANESSTTLLPPAELDPLDKELTPVASATLLPMAELESLIDNLCDNVVDSRHPSSQDAQEILGSNWIYFIDSGGQPHFHNLLPHFVHGISIALFTLKLSEQLDSHSIVEYYEDGKLISTPYRSPLTTIDTLKCLVRSMQSHTINGEKPTLVIVGTFLDKIEKSSETVQEKNERLLKILSLEFTDQLVFYNEAENKLIFALNGKDPGPHEETIAELIRSVVEDSPYKVIEMPIWWYVLEISLKEMSSRLNRKVLSKQECLEVAKQIHIEEDALVEALKFFHEQHIFHYYVDILPNIVFTSPQVLLDKLTELVKEAYDKRIKSTTTGQAQVAKGKWQKFQNNGIITLEFVEYFSKHYVKGLFSPPDLLKLFMNLLILTPFSPTDSKIDFTSRTAQYFMPSLLDMLPQDKLMEHRVVSILASPLLIRFPNGWPRAGVFCCLQVYLIHQLGWKLLLIRGKPKLIAQNCVLLSPPRSSCRVTLIDSFSIVEVHVDGVCSAMCPTIRNQIDTGIRASCQRLRYSEEQLQLAFFCPCTLSSSPHSEEIPHFHAAVLLEDGNLRCTFDESITSRVQSEEMIWFQNTAPATGHTVGSSSQPVGTVFQRLMDKYQLSTTAQASEPKKEDPLSSSPPPGSSDLSALRNIVDTTITGQLEYQMKYGDAYIQDPGTTSLHELMVKHGVTDEQLDREIAQNDLAPVAMHFDDVELYLNPLKLTGNEQADVRRETYLSRSNQVAVITCLSIWRGHEPSEATFRALIRILLDLRKQEIATRICQYLTLREEYQIPSTSTSGDIGEAVVEVTNKSNEFSNFGIKITVLENSLPKGIDTCVLHISFELSTDFEIPANSELVSSIYHVKCEPKVQFKKPVVLEIQYCASLSSEHQQRLVFARATDQSKQFEILEGGHFPIGERYGSIQLTRFSRLGVFIRKVFGIPIEKIYSALLFRKNLRCCDVIDTKCVICQDLDTHVKVIREALERDGFTKEMDLDQIQFENAVEMKLHPENSELWTVTSRASSTLSRDCIDGYSRVLDSNSRRGVVPAIHYRFTLKEKNISESVNFLLTKTDLDEESHHLILHIDSPATGHTVGSSSKPVSAVLQGLKKEAIADDVCHYIMESPTTSVGEGETQSLQEMSVARGQQHTNEQAVQSHTTEVRSGSGRGDEATEIDALLSNNGLTYKDVDEECTKDHIFKISLQLEKWELVATRLGLTPAEIEAIKSNDQNIEMMRLNCLKKWKSKALLSETATYRVLLQALLDCGCNDQAKQACSLLKELYYCINKKR